MSYLNTFDGAMCPKVLEKIFDVTVAMPFASIRFEKRLQL